MEDEKEKRLFDEDQFDRHVYQNDHAEVVQGHAAQPATPKQPEHRKKDAHDPRLHIKVNGEEIRMHNGLHVRNAIGERLAKEVENWRAIVRDRYGNIVGLDGGLVDGEELYITEYEDPAEVLQAYGFGRQDAQ